MQGHNKLDERLPSVDAFWGAGAEEHDIRREDLLQPREVVSVQLIKVMSDQTAVLLEVRWHICVSFLQASNASLAVSDRSTQLVNHDAMQHRPAHLPNGYSPERVEREFCELRLIGFLGCPHAACCISPILCREARPR